MSDFGNYGGYGDGGFSTDVGGGFSTDSGVNERSQTRTSLTPVTIKQINDAHQDIPDGEFKIHNNELNMVSFVGIIRKVEEQASGVIIKVEDGTGSIDIKRWTDKSGSLSEDLEKYNQELNKYIFVSGALKSFNDRKSIQNSVIYPVTDHNQILYHHLSAINAHLKAQGVTNKSSQPTNGLFVSENDNSSVSPEDLVFNIVRDNSYSMPSGVSIALITQKSTLSNAEIHFICQNLTEQGKLYQGSDEDSYLCV
ncbi:uncharacterized protein RJT21DRAFT_37650 [Scheffersomyces amazonensis]|uniref:uncharacterized protein n=1 Tax=Scheffersomyces amazonensis TaxID=1078765 RepID=UPI00315C68BF